MQFFKNLFKKKTPLPALQLPQEVIEQCAQYFDEYIIPEENKVRPFSGKSYAHYLAALREKENQQRIVKPVPEGAQKEIDRIWPQKKQDEALSRRYEVMSNSLLGVYVVDTSCDTAPDNTVIGQGGLFDGGGASGDWDSSTSGSTE